MNVLAPLMMYSSPSRTAVVAMDATSEPAPGSDMASARMVRPLMIPGSQRSACSGVQLLR